MFNFVTFFEEKKISFFILNSHGHIFLHSAFQFKHDIMFPLKLDCSVKDLLVKHLYFDTGPITRYG